MLGTETRIREVAGCSGKNKSFGDRCRSGSPTSVSFSTKWSKPFLSCSVVLKTGGLAWHIVGACANFSVHHTLFLFSTRLEREQYCPHSLGEEASTPEGLQGNSNRKIISLLTPEHGYHSYLAPVVSRGLC